MFQLKEISGKNTLRIKNFSFSQETGVTHVLLSASVSFLDELQAILLGREPLRSGAIIFGGEQYTNTFGGEGVHLISKENMLFLDLTVEQNILVNQGLLKKRNPNHTQKFSQILQETGFSLPRGSLVKNLTSEEQKIVEIVRCYYMNPKFLVVRELSGVLSYSNFKRFLKVLDTMNLRGTTILYLTSQWEETLKLSKDVTVVTHGENLGTFPYEEVKKDPSELCNLVMGRLPLHKEEDGEKDIDRLLSLSSNIQKGIGDYNIHNTLLIYSQYLLKEMTADSVLIYLIDNRRDSIIDYVSQVRDEDRPSTENLTPHFKFAFIKDFIGSNKSVYINRNDLAFPSYFETPSNIMASLGYPTTLNEDIAFFIQINYAKPYTYSEHDTLVITWVAQEMSLFIENSRLMGHSVLLRESYHRIKNNLQIIASLMEMEKEAFSRDIAMQAFSSTIDRVKCIAQIHDLLTHESIRDSFTDMCMIVKETCIFYRNHVHLDLDFDQIYVPHSKVVSIALVINELISNSIKHNAHQEKLKISIAAKLDKNSQIIHLVYHDNGVGFPCAKGEEFKNHSDGVGMMVIESVICYELGGQLRFSNDSGALVEIHIPMRTLLPIEKRDAIWD